MVSPVNSPQEVEVTACESGEPVAVRLGRAWKKVASIRNTWRIDDEWWNVEISRLYFEVELDGGLPVVVFYDMVSGKWYRQRR